MVHLGVGGFARAHPIWFTEHAEDHAGWGVAGFTGRGATVADQLGGQEGLYTLLVRAPEADRREIVSTLSEVHPATDLAAWRHLLADRAVAVVTLTVTEAGYRRRADGGLDTSDHEVAEDLTRLRADGQADAVRTVPGRVVAGLLARRSAAGGPIALVPCDNVPANGAMLRRVTRELADAVDPTLPAWLDENVSFVTTTVDRITPRTTAEDRAQSARTTGVGDPALVVTEPFAEWVLSGDFPAGRPRWETAGARFVDHIEPFEARKLWLLNGAHSLMAYAGSALGHRTVNEAIANPTVRGWVDAWWNLASPHLGLPTEETAVYREALLERFANPRMRHQLAQIAADGSQKLPIRILPVLNREFEAGRAPEAATRVLAAWVVHLRGHGVPVDDVAAADLLPLVGDSVGAAVRALLDRFGLTQPGLAAMVRHQVEDLERLVATLPA